MMPGINASSMWVICHFVAYLEPDSAKADTPISGVRSNVWKKLRQFGYMCARVMS